MKLFLTLFAVGILFGCDSSTTDIDSQSHTITIDAFSHFWLYTKIFPANYTAYNPILIDSSYDKTNGLPSHIVDTLPGPGTKGVFYSTQSIPTTFSCYHNNQGMVLQQDTTGNAPHVLKFGAHFYSVVHTDTVITEISCQYVVGKGFQYGSNFDVGEYIIHY